MSLLMAERQFLPWHRAWPCNYAEGLALATLALLGAINKQIRSESQARFWSKLPLYLTSVDGDAGQHEALHMVLTRLSPEARASIPAVELRDLRPSTGYGWFQKLLPVVAMCISLRHLSLGLLVSNVFRSDVEALQSYFIVGQPLVSPDLERLADTLASLSNLNTVHIHCLGDRCLHREFDPATERFFYFAFTGMPEIMVWIEIKERLSANAIRKTGETRKFNGKTFVWMHYPHQSLYRDGDDMVDYQAWSKWLDETYPGGMDQEGVALIE